MEIFAYAGAQIVPIAHPVMICKQVMALKTKLFKVSIKFKNSMIPFVAKVLAGWLL